MASLTIFLYEVHNEYQGITLSYEQCWSLILQGAPILRVMRTLKEWTFTGPDAEELWKEQSNFKADNLKSQIIPILAEMGIPRTALEAKDVVYYAGINAWLVKEPKTANANP